MTPHNAPSVPPLPYPLLPWMTALIMAATDWATIEHSCQIPPHLSPADAADVYVECDACYWQRLVDAVPARVRERAAADHAANEAGKPVARLAILPTSETLHLFDETSAPGDAHTLCGRPNACTAMGYGTPEEPRTPLCTRCTAKAAT